MKIAVLMTCYNRVETTLACLRALHVAAEHVPGLDLRVFLVDDGSPDATGVRVMEAFPDVTVVAGSGSLFWCKGMNLAWRMAMRAGADWDAFLWLNDDVMLDAEALGGIVGDAESTEWAGAVVGAFLDGRGKMTYGVLENWRWIEPTGSPRETTGDISGNLVLVPKSVCDRVGIMADCYSHAYGDYDYSARMRKAGVRYYLASRVCGRCDNEKPDYALEAKSLWQRVRCLFQPNGHNWRDAVVYRWRHYGLWRTILTAIHVPYLVIRGKRK